MVRFLTEVDMGVILKVVGQDLAKRSCCSGGASWPRVAARLANTLSGNKAEGARVRLCAMLGEPKDTVVGIIMPGGMKITKGPDNA